MKEQHFTKKQMICAVLITVVLTLSGLFVLMGALLGRDGLAVMEGFVLLRTIFVGDADLKKVADDALLAMVGATGDRWSFYLHRDWNKVQQEYEANRATGIGVRILYGEEGLLITDTVPGGGADQAGLKPGEILRSVEGNPLYGEGREANTALIKGENGTHVTLTVRAVEGGEREVKVLRGTWYDPPVRYEMLEGDVGCIRLYNFNAGAAKAFRTAVEDLTGQGAQALIFDLRQNGGGFIDELSKMLDQLLPEGVIFQQTTSWGWSFQTKSDAESVDLPMAVLVDAESYSCAELFAAQLKESVGAWLVGEHTSGKGYFQYHFPMPNGGGLGLSIGRYTTGAGVSLAGVGIQPDQEISLTEEEKGLLQAHWLKPAEDPAIRAALEWLETVETK